GDTLWVDVANRSDHQIKWEPKLRAELGQHPEHCAANVVMFVFTQGQPVDRLTNRGGRSRRRRSPRREVRWQADGAGPGAPRHESFEELPQGTPQAGIIVHIRV